MRDKRENELFAQHLEAVVRHQPLTVPDSAPKALRAELRLAEELARLDLGAESAIREGLRASLSVQAGARGWTPQAHPAPASAPRPSLAWPARLRPVGAGMAVILLVLVMAFNQPVLATGQRILGYGYLPETGFFRLSETVLLSGPVVQDHEGITVTVRQGVISSQRTRLWLRFDGPPQSLEGAWLELADGQRLPAESWSWLPDEHQPTGGMVSFPALPAGTRRSTLGLPTGWLIPVEWAPAREVSLAPTKVSVPYPTTTPTGWAAQRVCVTATDTVRICVNAAFVDAEGTHILLEGEAIAPGAQLTWVVDIGGQAIQLVDEQRRVYPLKELITPEKSAQLDQASLSLRFSPLPSEVRVVTLRLSTLTFHLSGQPGSAKASESLTIPGPFFLAFSLPERQPTVSPTPRAVSENRASPYPAPTPTIAQD
jgi:hypothetical protein